MFICTLTATSAEAAVIICTRRRISRSLKPFVGNPYKPSRVLRVSTVPTPQFSKVFCSVLQYSRFISDSFTCPTLTPPSMPPCPASSATTNCGAVPPNAATVSEHSHSTKAAATDHAAHFIPYADKDKQRRRPQKKVQG